MVTGAPIKILAILVGIFTAIGASFGAMNTMYAQVSARTREIGTLRAIGFSRRSVLASFVLEALLAVPHRRRPRDGRSRSSSSTCS